MLGKYSISRELRSYMLILRSLVSCNLRVFFLGFYYACFQGISIDPDKVRAIID